MTTHPLKNEPAQPGDAVAPARFLFRCGARSLHASGIAATIANPANDGGHAGGHFQRAIDAGLAQARLAGVANPIVMGAIPFDTTEPSCLYVPQQYHWSDTSTPAVPDRSADATLVMQRSVPDEQGFKDAVTQAIASFRSSTLRKAVLSRRLDLQLGAPVDVERVLANLAAQNPAGYHFRVPMPEGAELIGVSPELLLRKQAGLVFSNPLAGSAKRRGDAHEDRHAAEALLQSPKDNYEHRLVIEDIRQVLQGDCRQLDIPSQPSLLSTTAMWHLSTAIEGQLRDPEQSVLQLACRLHPTPAVCGAPTDLARQLIERVEPFERGLFTGMVGWCDSHGNGEWVVTIRCATVHGDRLQLFAGAGIVEASDPAAEWAETQAKLGTMLAAFGLAPLEVKA